MKELWKDRKTGWAAPLNEWFNSPYYDRLKEKFSEWKEKNLVSLWAEEVRFVLGLGMKIIFGYDKIPVKGIKWGDRKHIFPNEQQILNFLRKEKGMIAAEMARSNMICLDYDREFKEDDLVYPFFQDTLRNMTPGSGGNHLFYWNDVFYTPLGHKKNGDPLPVGHSKWLKEWTRENPGLLDALFSECDIARIRNEIAWIPPSETPSGEYHWAEPRRPPMLFSELLISLSKGRR